MNDDLHDDERMSSRGTLRGGHLALIALVAIAAVVAFVYYFQWRAEQPPEPIPEDRVIEVSEGTRAVTLYFAAQDSENLVTETRLVAIGREFGDQVARVVEALLEGPELSGVSTISNGTGLLGVFYDAERATLYLDFTSELVAGHPGGSSAEYYTIAAIMRTVSENFPEVEAVQLLVEGLQIGTIGGHIDAYKPFLVSDWR